MAKWLIMKAVDTVLPVLLLRLGWAIIAGLITGLFGAGATVAVEGWLRSLWDALAGD